MTNLAVKFNVIAFHMRFKKLTGLSRWLLDTFKLMIMSWLFGIMSSIDIATTHWWITAHLCFTLMITTKCLGEVMYLFSIKKYFKKLLTTILTTQVINKLLIVLLCTFLYTESQRETLQLRKINKIAKYVLKFLPSPMVLDLYSIDIELNVALSVWRIRFHPWLCLYYSIKYIFNNKYVITIDDISRS